MHIFLLAFLMKVLESNSLEKPALQHGSTSTTASRQQGDVRRPQKHDKRIKLTSADQIQQTGRENHHATLRRTEKHCPSPLWKI